MSLNVLIVDDDKMITLLHRVIAVRSNLCENPLTFSNGKDAFEFLENDFTEDKHYLILLDINMPVMNGWEFLDAIQPMPFAHNVSVVMLTSSVDTGDKNRAAQYPQIITFMEKPLKTDGCIYLKSLPIVNSYFY